MVLTGEIVHFNKGDWAKGCAVDLRDLCDHVRDISFVKLVGREWILISINMIWSAIKFDL